MNSLVTSIKRNPIIIMALAVIAMQIWQDWGNFTTQDWFKNLFTLSVAIIAREFTVPAKEHNATIEALNNELHPRG